jgi:hypothetical protein
MWAVGARKVKLSDFMAKHAGHAPKDSSWFQFGRDGGLSIDVNYAEAQVLTNVADPSFPGRSKIARRLKSVPKGSGAELVAEGMALPPAFTQALPGVPGPRNVILPDRVRQQSGALTRQNQSVLAWDFVYVRADVEGADRVRTLSGPLLDYFREG